MKRIALLSFIILVLLSLDVVNIYTAWIKKEAPKIEKKEEKVVEPAKKTEKLPSGVDFIKASALETDKVKLNWEPPSEQNIQALIYRNTEVINTRDKFSQSTFITNISADYGEFIDTIQNSGKYYYAIITTKNGLTNSVLIEDQNFISLPVEVTIATLPPPVRSISATLADDKKSVTIKWKGDVSVQEYTIYRATNVIDTIYKLESAELIGTVEKGVESFVDTFLKGAGKYYYIVTTLNEAGENKEFIPGETYTTTAIEIKEEKPVEIKVKKEEEKPIVENKVVSKPKLKKSKPKIRINYELKLERIIKNNYYSKNFDKTIIELEKMLRSRAPAKVKNKATLFLAKSYYYSNNYKKALSLFIKLQDVYPDEASFWITRASMKLK